ncbi:putative mRNA decapping protein [Neospora caninum Liverpool]|uniref:Putative mRNA decapping protein n=1 Tax=Neospora caninum (strain Liverpool) TaxID=572307 RepID=F0VLL2_NEOCL|nr:putative mRNA decapping protein [Neospora caninum Liverpool]CBZ54140.1 putative mRNA decapping protein [Neospora caninum Liverpool]CEL68839.1 TPA: mRNA decapping protein, putative [Neospora caninum Liverpool]|eukprot:XP_003884171.1 putative mRNA decapping protein [Neospora caninum Liverpool]
MSSAGQSLLALLRPLPKVNGSDATASYPVAAESEENPERRVAPSGEGLESDVKRQDRRPGNASPPACTVSRGSAFAGVPARNVSSEAARQHSSGFTVTSTTAASGVSSAQQASLLPPHERDPAILSASPFSPTVRSAPSPVAHNSPAQHPSVAATRPIRSSTGYTSSSSASRLHPSELSADTRSVYSMQTTPPSPIQELPSGFPEREAPKDGFRSDGFRLSEPLETGAAGAEGNTGHRTSAVDPKSVSSLGALPSEPSVSNTSRVLLAALGSPQPTLSAHIKREEIGFPPVYGALERPANVDLPGQATVPGAQDGRRGSPRLSFEMLPASTVAVGEESYAVSSRRKNAGVPVSEFILTETRTVEVRQRTPERADETKRCDVAGSVHAFACLDGGSRGSLPRVTSPSGGSSRAAFFSFPNPVSSGAPQCVSPVVVPSSTEPLAEGILGASTLPAVSAGRSGPPREAYRTSCGQSLGLKKDSAGWEVLSAGEVPGREDAAGSEKKDEKKEKGRKKKRKKDRENEEKKERSTPNSSDNQGGPSCNEATANDSTGAVGADASTNLTAEREKANGIKRKCRDSALLDEALLDCYGRFITLLPDAFLRDRIHLYFQIQEAFWWYDDIWWEKHADRLPKLTLKDFGCLICHDCPILQHYIPPEKHDKFLANWKRYCRTIPLRGAIILNEDLSKCLMVTGWKGGTWMFPRGKVDEMEQDAVCACREIWEEVGVDISPYIDDEVYVEHVIEEQPIKLFIIPGIKETVNFQPLKRKEIGRIGWIDTWRLPGWQLSPLHPNCPTSAAILEQQKYLRTWQVEPFIPALRGWIELLKKSARRVAAVAAGSPTSMQRTGGVSPLSSVSLQLPASSSTCIAGCYYQVAPDVSRHVIEHLQDAARALPYSAALAGVRLKPPSALRQCPSPQKGRLNAPGGSFPDTFQAATSLVTRPPQRQIGTLPWTGSVAAGPAESVASGDSLLPNSGSLRTTQPQGRKAGAAAPGVRTPVLPVGGEAGAGSVCTPEGVPGENLNEGLEESIGHADDAPFGDPCSVSGGAGFSGYHLPAAGTGRGHLVGMRLREVGLRSFDDQDVERRRALQQLTFGGPSSAFVTAKAPSSPSSTGERAAKTPRGNRPASSSETSSGEGRAAAGADPKGQSAASAGGGKKKGSPAAAGGDPRDSCWRSPPVAAPARKKATSLDDLGVTYHVTTRGSKRGERAGPGSCKKTRAWGWDRCNDTTFGGGHGGGWSVEEMFRFNEENFGVVSTYDIESYTVPLPKKRPSLQGGEGNPRHGPAWAGAGTDQSALPQTQPLRQIGVASAGDIPEGGRARGKYGGRAEAAVSQRVAVSCRAREEVKGEERQSASSSNPQPLQSKVATPPEDPRGEAARGTVEKSDPRNAGGSRSGPSVTTGVSVAKGGSPGTPGGVPELLSSRLCQNAQASAALLGLLKGSAASQVPLSLPGRGEARGQSLETAADSRLVAGDAKAVHGGEGSSPAEASEATKVAPASGMERVVDGSVVIKGPFVFDAFLQKVQEQRAGLALPQVESPLPAKVAEEKTDRKAEGGHRPMPTRTATEGTAGAGRPSTMQAAVSPPARASCSPSTGPSHRLVAGPEAGRETGYLGTGGDGVCSTPKTPSCVSPPRYLAEKQRRQQEALAKSVRLGPEDNSRTLASPPPAPYIHSIDSPGYVSEGPTLGRLANALGSEVCLPSLEYLNDCRERDEDACGDDGQRMRNSTAVLSRTGDRWAGETAGIAEGARAGGVRGLGDSPAVLAQNAHRGNDIFDRESLPIGGIAPESCVASGEDGRGRKGNTNAAKKAGTPGPAGRSARQRQLSDVEDPKDRPQGKATSRTTKHAESVTHPKSGADATAQDARGRESLQGPNRPELGSKRERRQRRGQRRGAGPGSRGGSRLRSGEQSPEDGAEASDEMDEYEHHTILGKLRRLSQDLIPVPPAPHGTSRKGHNSRPSAQTQDDGDAATGVNESAMVEVFSMWLSQGQGASK